jgi:ribosomal-protein-alanine N-acetyltransferase
MVLHGTRAVVRYWRASDAESLVRHANNIEIAKQLRDRFPHPYTAADAKGFLAFAMRDEAAPSNLAIEVEGAAVGGIGFVRGADVERYSAEIGYWIGQAYWGRGIVTEAVSMVTEHLFRVMNLLRLFALPLADNAASVRVLEKAGYVREAVLRSSCVKYEKPRDQLLYARVNDRWKGVSGGSPPLTSRACTA